MKNFKSTAWILPQPVLIIGTYDKNGKPNAMNAAWGGGSGICTKSLSHSVLMLQQTTLQKTLNLRLLSLLPTP